MVHVFPFFIFFFEKLHTSNKISVNAVGIAMKTDLYEYMFSTHEDYIVLYKTI